MFVFGKGSLMLSNSSCQFRCPALSRTSAKTAKVEGLNLANLKNVHLDSARSNCGYVAKRLRMDFR